MSVYLSSMFQRASWLATLAVFFGYQVSNCKDTVEIDAQGKVTGLKSLAEACEGRYFSVDDDQYFATISGAIIKLTDANGDESEYELSIHSETKFRYTDGDEEYEAECHLPPKCKLVFEKIGSEDGSEIWKKIGCEEASSRRPDDKQAQVPRKEKGYVLEGLYLKGKLVNGKCVVEDPETAKKCNIDMVEKTLALTENRSGQVVEDYYQITKSNATSVTFADQEDDEFDPVTAALRDSDTLMFDDFDVNSTECFLRKQEREFELITFEAGFELGFSIDKESRLQDTVDYVNKDLRAAKKGVMIGWKILEINGEPCPGDGPPPLKKLMDLKKPDGYPELRIKFDATEGELGSKDLPYFEECVKDFQKMEPTFDGSGDDQEIAAYFDDFMIIKADRDALVNRIKKQGADRIVRLNCAKLGEGCLDMSPEDLKKQSEKFRDKIDETIASEPPDDVYFGVHDVCKLIVACRKGTETCKK